jgi:uncharacterized MnhB-related membrane protein
MIAFDLIVCGMIIAVALAAVAGRGAFRAVVFFITYGVMIALAWLRLGAFDVALAEAAIGAGLTGVLLLGAVARLRRAGSEDEIPCGLNWPAVVGAFAVISALVWAVITMPPVAGLTGQVIEVLPQTGVENPVTAVLLNLRAWDTLLESIVLLAALLAVWSLSQDGVWGERPGLIQHARPDGVLVSLGRLLPPVGLLVGVYLVWAGASRPGGAFQGGTVLAAVGLLAAMSGLVRPPRVTSQGLRLALIIGPLVFLLVGLWGLGAGGFLLLPEDIAKPLILGIELALTVSIAVTLALLILGPPEEEGRE